MSQLHQATDKGKGLLIKVEDLGVDIHHHHVTPNLVDVFLFNRERDKVAEVNNHLTTFL